MNPGFPFRNRITDRGWNVDYGGDGRYLWDIARVDKTVSIIDLSTNTTVATLSIPAIVDWSTGNYVPADKLLYIHYTTGHTRIDLDPTSLSFATIVGSDTTLGTTSGNVVNYWQELDAFVGVSNGFNFRPRKSPANSFTIPSVLAQKNVVAALAQGIGCIATGSANPSQSTGWINLRNSQCYNLGTFVSIVAPVINNKFLIEFYELDQNGNVIRSINTSGAQGAYSLEFCPKSKRLVGGGGNASGYRLAVYDHKSFLLIGNTPYINTPNSSVGYQYRNVVYSPYTGLIYARTCYHAANVKDIHIYDCTLALASMYQGYIESGNDRVPAVSPYNNCTMGLNRLKNDEHYY